MEQVCTAWCAALYDLPSTAVAVTSSGQEEQGPAEKAQRAWATMRKPSCQRLC